jgi:heme a synthase
MCHISNWRDNLVRYTQKTSDKLIANWLYFMALLVVAMIVVGGATRLTDAGLSIAHWAPIHGIIPPLSEKDWLQEFELYRNIPEFKLQNNNMDLSEFKFIFWWEWAHRFLGRIVGLAFLIPLIVFSIRKNITRKDAPILIAILLLIGLQGFLGWWMVSSGLQGTRLDVEALRLMVHLGMAFFLLWILLSVAHGRKTGEKIHISSNPWTFILIITYLQILLGALVAGNDAGLGNNDWPLMNGHFFPKDYFALSPIISNFIENGANVQFNHRILGYLILITVFFTRKDIKKIKKDNYQKWSTLAFAAIILQVCFGILTLFVFANYPPPTMNGVIMGIIHQFNAAITFCLIVFAWKTYPNYRS